MDSLDEFIGESPAVAALRESVRRLLGRQSSARRAPPVLLLGETGTGKGLLAKLLHRASTRRAEAFVDVNCPAIPNALLESELFGHERGAFTDAREARTGLFAAAHHGTIFLDEIGLLADAPQGKLLKIIEDGTVRRLGSSRSEPVDTWVMAATSEDLPGRVRDGSFREDLYHRLSVVTLMLPPLRERGDDTILLAEQYLARACADYGMPPKTLSPAARAMLLRYGWPGNIRELANAMERLALLVEADVIGPESLGLPEAARPRRTSVHVTAPVDRSIDTLQREHALAALVESNWNITRAAAALLITRNTLKARIRKYGLRPEAGHPAAVAEPDSTTAGPPAMANANVDVSTGRPAVLWEPRRLMLLRVQLSMSPEEALELGSGRAVETVVEKVLSFGGRIEELSWTTATAVFGLGSVEDAPRRAANAAIAIERGLKRDRGSTGGAVAFALHFAELVVAGFGSASVIEERSKREAWDALERLGHLGVGGGAIATASAAALLRRHFELVPMDTAEAAGSGAYRLVGHERAGFSPPTGAASLVGREAELGALGAAFAATSDGRGQVVILSGQPGIGKSRLIYEFLRALGERDCLVLETSCPSHGTAVPYLPIGDLLLKGLGVEASGDPSTLPAAIGRALTALEEPPSRDTQIGLLALLGSSPAGDRFFALAPGEQRRRMRQSMHQFLLALSRRRPLILIVEDLHWGDAESQELLDSLVEQLSAARVLLIASHRPEYEHVWPQKGHVAQIALEPLHPESMQSLLSEILGTDRRLGPLKALIVQRTEGNPFFLEETVRTLAEARILVGERGAYEVAAAVDAIQVPPTVEAVLATRIHRLAAEHKHILQTAAVIGRTVPLTLLAAVAQEADPAVEAALDELERADFLVDVPAGASSAKLFKHALTQEVAYDSLLPDQRRALHGRVLDAVEHLHGERLGEHIETAAHHAYQAGRWARAHAYGRQAGARAAGRSAHREAVLWLTQALAAVERLPSTPETLAESIDLRFELRNTLWALGELSRGLDYLREARPLAERLGDQRRLARLLAHTSSNLLVLGDFETAREIGERALSLAKSLDDGNLQVDCNQFLGVLNNSLGEYRRAVGFLDANIAALAGSRGRFADFYAVHSRTWLVWSLCELGEFERAGQLAAEAKRIAEASQQAHCAVAANWAQGYLCLAKGDGLVAIPCLESALSVCQAAEIVVWSRPCMAALGRAYALTGRFSEALPLLERTLETDENTIAFPEWETYLAEAYLLEGRRDDAAERARHAVELAERHREVGFAAHAHAMLGRIAEPLGDLAGRRAHWQIALRLSLERQMRPLAAHSHFELARLASAMRDDAAAGSHQAAASALFEEMGLPLPPE